MRPAEPHSLARTLEPVALALLLVGIVSLLGRLPDWRGELGRFQALLVLAFGAYALALARRTRWRALPRAGAFVVLVALALRAAVFAVPPMLSDDVYRYAWEGRVLAAGANPYAHAPDDPALASLRDREVYSRVNHPSLSAIYPPLAEAGFALVARAAFSVFAFKLWIVLHDLVLCAVLAAWCARRGGSAWDAIAYAWNPLVVTEYAGSGHHDPTGMLWLVLALAWAERRPLASGLAASASVLVKLVALPALPFLWRGWDARARLVATLITGAGLALYAALTRGAHSGLAAFAAHWRHNDALFGPLAAVAGETGARFLVAGIVLALLIALFVRRVDAAAGTRLVLRAGLLLGPVVHPWYLGWVLALEPLAISPAWLLLSCTVTLGYGAFAAPAEGGAYHPGPAWRSLEYGLPALLAVGLAWRARARGRDRDDRPLP